MFSFEFFLFLFRSRVDAGSCVSGYFFFSLPDVDDVVSSSILPVFVSADFFSAAVSKARVPVLRFFSLLDVLCLVTLHS